LNDYIVGLDFKLGLGLGGKKLNAEDEERMCFYYFRYFMALVEPDLL
jgi:hypothetical protein